jgi:hypothetical protein
VSTSGTGQKSELKGKGRRARAPRPPGQRLPGAPPVPPPFGTTIAPLLSAQALASPARAHLPAAITPCDDDAGRRCRDGREEAEGAGAGREVRARGSMMAVADLRLPRSCGRRRAGSQPRARPPAHPKPPAGARSQKLPPCAHAHHRLAGRCGQISPGEMPCGYCIIGA